MWGRRIAYLAALGFSVIFFCFFQEWFSWVLLVGLLWLPVLSLILSLPALLTTKVTLQCPDQVRLGVPARIALNVESPLPPPPARSKVRLENHLTGERFVGYPGEHVPTGNCGLVTVCCRRLRIYDYLGLWRFPLRKERLRQVYVLPKPVPDKLPPMQAQLTVNSWKIKRGGGFAENHDLRLYRPGDDLRNVHWKLSAKTGKLIYREALEPVLQQYMLQLTLSGTGKELSQKLGKLLWLSLQLLNQGKAHQIRCATGEGMLEFFVNDRKTQEMAIFRLLESTTLPAEQKPKQKDALWLHYIGGEDDG